MEWTCPKCGEQASGPDEGVKAVVERHNKTKHKAKGTK